MRSNCPRRFAIAATCGVLLIAPIRAWAAEPQQPPTDRRPVGQAESEDDPAVRVIGSRLELFVDDWLIDRSEGSNLALHKPIREEVVLKIDQPWERIWEEQPEAERKEQLARGVWSGPTPIGFTSVMKDGELFRKYDGLSDGVFMCSRDGIHWDRRFMESFIEHGQERENWTERNPLPTWGAVPTSPQEMSVYWVEHFRHPTIRLRRGSLRTDGFVSLHGGYAGGEVLTHPLTFQGSRLVLNYKTSAVGSVRVELLSPSGEAIPGLAGDEAPELYGDAVAEEYRWTSTAVLGESAGKPVRLRIHLKDADLYALQFHP